MFLFDQLNAQQTRSRVLREEFDKKDELSRIHAALEDLLREEQSKRENLEEQKQHQENLLREEQTKLDQLYAEHRQRDEEYQVNYSLSITLKMLNCTYSNMHLACTGPVFKRRRLMCTAPLYVVYTFVTRRHRAFYMMINSRHLVITVFIIVFVVIVLV